MPFGCSEELTAVYIISGVILCLQCPLADPAPSRHKTPCLKVTKGDLSKPPYLQVSLDFSHSMILTVYLPRMRTRMSVLFPTTKIDGETSQVK